MTIYTLLDEDTIGQGTTNKHLNKVFSAVRDTVNDDIRVVERFRRSLAKKWWQFYRKNEIKPLYTLYVKTIDGYAYWQVINFYSDTSGTSINTEVSAEVMIAYLYGMLAGIYSVEFNSRKNEDVRKA